VSNGQDGDIEGILGFFKGSQEMVAYAYRLGLITIGRLNRVLSRLCCFTVRLHVVLNWSMQKKHYHYKSGWNQFLASTFDAPLGFGMDIQAEFSKEGAVIRSGGEVEEVPVDPERALVRGTFGTYAIIPLLFELRGMENEASLETLVFGGPPNRDDADVGGLPETRISQIEDATIQFGDRQLVVSQYQISGDMGTMMLFALGVELLGMIAVDAEDSLLVYRADYFEDGFEVLQ